LRLGLELLLYLFDEFLFEFAIDGDAEEEKKHFFHFVEGRLGVGMLSYLVDVGQFDQEYVIENVLVEGARIAQYKVEIEET
jgi:hypothetical protein